MRLEARLCAALGGDVLIDLLRAERAAGLQAACAFGVGGGFHRGGLSFGHASARFGQIGLHRRGRKTGEPLAAAHDTLPAAGRLGIAFARAGLLLRNPLRQ